MKHPIKYIVFTKKCKAPLSTTIDISPVMWHNHSTKANMP